MTVQPATLLGLKSAVLLRRVLLVALGGAAGSVARYVVGLWTAQAFGAFPWGTFSVNVLGAFAIGVLVTLADELHSIGPETRALLVVGVLGGFTTWSSFSYDTVHLVQEHELPRAVLYLGGSLMLSLLCTALGIGLTRNVYR
jgi:CrcB protein